MVLGHPKTHIELHPKSWKDVSSCGHRMGSAGCEVTGTKSIGILSVEFQQKDMVVELSLQDRRRKPLEVWEQG